MTSKNSDVVNSKCAVFISTRELLHGVCQKGRQLRVEVFLKHTATEHKSVLVKTGLGVQEADMHTGTHMNTRTHAHRDTHAQRHVNRYLNCKFLFGSYRIIINQISSFLDIFYQKAR